MTSYAAVKPWIIPADVRQWQTLNWPHRSPYSSVSASLGATENQNIVLMWVQVFNRLKRQRQSCFDVFPVTLCGHWTLSQSPAGCSLNQSTCQFTRCWCGRWEEFLWPGRGPPLAPCSSAPGGSSPDRTPRAQSRPRCSGNRAGGWMVWRWAWSWSWPLCQRTQSLLHIYLTGRGRPQGGTRSPRGSRQAGRRCAPGRWPRSAPPWRSWSQAAQSRPARDLSSPHLVEANEKWGD